MYSICTRVEWFEEIKEKMPVFDPYFFVEHDTEYVEFDVESEEEFDRISQELGWM